MSEPPRPLIGFGQVRHTRLRPKRHSFVYDTFFLMLPMRHLAANPESSALAVNRRGALSFHDCDHGDARGPDKGGALAWILELLLREGIGDVQGEIWLHTYPRVWGYTFKPVSFWYCHRADDTLAAVVVEVNNTFGERHCYLLDSPRFGLESTASKCFHVSPFCRAQGRYRFRFLRTWSGERDRTVVRIEHDDDQGAMLTTSVSGTLEAITPEMIARALWRYPAMTMMIMLRIHWQALRLWAKRVAFFRKPVAPEHFVTR